MPKNCKTLSSACAEGIALSFFFSRVPARATRNVLRPLPVEQDAYVLPFDKERDLSEAFAFLAKTKDGFEYIPAVCVEQNLPGTELSIILAINKSTHADGDDLLETLKGNLERICKVLHDSLYGMFSLFATCLPLRPISADTSQKIEYSQKSKKPYLYRSPKCAPREYYLV
jgi:hypothetical protein